jgi:hypothetical protein
MMLRSLIECQTLSTKPSFQISSLGIAGGLIYFILDYCFQSSSHWSPAWQAQRRLVSPLSRNDFHIVDIWLLNLRFNRRFEYMRTKQQRPQQKQRSPVECAFVQWRPVSGTVNSFPYGQGFLEMHGKMKQIPDRKGRSYRPSPGTTCRNVPCHNCIRTVKFWHSSLLLRRPSCFVLIYFTIKKRSNL